MKLFAKSTLIALPISLLAACGGSAPEEPATPTSDAAEAAAPTPSDAAAGQATPPAQTAAPAEDTAVPAASSTPAIAAATPAPAPVAAAAPPAAFAVCKACHSTEPGRNMVGPSLAGIYGRKAASVEGYPYSPALKNANITWTEDKLDTWLQSPMKMAPGTKMVLGTPDAAKRKAIIEYLETLK